MPVADPGTSTDKEAEVLLPTHLVDAVDGALALGESDAEISAVVAGRRGANSAFSKYHRYTARDLRFIEAHFNRDLTAAQIAACLGRTSDAIMKAAAGLRVASRNVMRWSPEAIAEVRRLAEQGLIASEIGRVLGVSKDAVICLARRKKIGLHKGRAGRPKRKDDDKPSAVVRPSSPA